MTSLLKHKRELGYICIAFVLLLLFQLKGLANVEHQVQDIMFQKPTMVDPNIVVFGIDEKSLQTIGRYSDWGRDIYAEAINILNSSEDYKPALIGIDILYDGVGADYEADELLARAAEESGNVVVSSLAFFGEDMNLNKVIKEHVKPYPLLAERAEYGLANGTMDDDGVIRRALLKADFNGDTLYSFPYIMYRNYTGDTLSDYLEKNNEIYITYYGKPGAYYGTESLGLSFSDIFNEEFEPEYFADCIVLIGPYASALSDSYYSPVSKDTQMYGVEIHANALQTLLYGSFKQYVPHVVNLLALALIISAALVLAQLLDIRVLLGVFFAIAVGYIILLIITFKCGYILTVIYPLFSLAVIFIYQLIYSYVRELMEKQKVKNAFKKYVDPKLVDKLMETGEADSDEVGVLKDIAVLFVDVRGFTPMTEAIKDDPRLIVHILNDYLELTSTAVFNNGGSVDKFIGDATMALFNGFVPLDDYVFRAVKTAWEIVKEADTVNALLKEKYNVDVGFGVGVNCGKAIVGNLGPSFRKDYTAIGDVVNTAARLESNAKRSEVLISSDVYEIVKGRVKAVSVGEIPLKGKSERIEVFSVTDVNY